MKIVVILHERMRLQARNFIIVVIEIMKFHLSAAFLGVTVRDAKLEIFNSRDSLCNVDDDDEAMYGIVEIFEPLNWCN
jgi:hypothetical protein